MILLYLQPKETVKMGQIENVDAADIADFFSPTFIGFQKIRDFQTSVFLIFIIGEYRKLDIHYR